MEKKISTAPASISPRGTSQGKNTRDISPGVKRQKSLDSKLDPAENKRLLVDKIRKKKQNKEIKNRNKIDQENRLTVKSLCQAEAHLDKFIKHISYRDQIKFLLVNLSVTIGWRNNVYEEGNGGTSIIQRLQSEIQTHKQLSQCKYVVKLYDFVRVQNQGYYLFMEMCDIDLGGLIKERRYLPQTQALDMFKQLVRGYKYLYDHGVSHRDLKPQNLMLQGKNLKISDFGFVKVHTNAELVLRSAQKNLCMAQSLVGSINYIAPDIIIAEKEKKKYSPFRSDVWSMGIILYKMLYGKQPYQAVQTSQLLQKIQKQPLKFPDEPKVSQNTINLMKKMIEKDQDTRIAFKALSQLILGQENEQKGEKIQSSVLYSQKQRLLVFYNLLITKISYDSAHHATLRELGISQYQKYSSRLMTLIHEKRLSLLKSAGKDVQPQIRKQILNYNEIFYRAIKQASEMEKLNEDLATILRKFKDCLKQYEQFQMLHQQVQYFLLLLLLLYNLQRGYVSTDYIFTVIQKQKNSKMNLKKLQELTKKNLDYK